MTTTERHQVAQELALKDGHPWETLSEVMVNAYLHNADLVIAERNRPPVDKVTGKPIYTCPRCKDKAYIDGKPCLECNPVGLPAEQVHAKVEKVDIVEPIKVNLCDTCVFELPTCLKVGVEEQIEWGDAFGRDNVIKCSAYKVKEEGKVETPRILGPGEYRCSKCNLPHKSSSKIGKKHLGFKL